MIKHWQVGGHVRDRIMGVRSKDIDYAVEAPSYDALVAWIREQGGTVFTDGAGDPIGKEYFTVRGKLPGGQVADYVLCRKEGAYSDGRRPDSVEIGTLFDDLSRRDFTVNAIAFDEATGEYIDPFDGRGDIARHLLKCVGDPHERFTEDALRLLRAIRFSITKGFVFDVKIFECLHSGRLSHLLRENVSVERKREELQRCFAHSTPTTLEILARFPLISDACFGDRQIRLLPTQREI